MQLLIDLVQSWGLGLVFLAVLIEQLGVPIPSIPILVVTAALSTTGEAGLATIIGVAVLASLIADITWYVAGARMGQRVIRLMCRISLSQDTCVRQTEGIYERWGAPSLMLAKFIPGFGALATVMAGVVRTRPLSFIVFDSIGAALWSGTAVLVGWIFRDAVQDVLDVIDAAGKLGLLLITAAIALFLVVKWMQRRRLLAQLRMARVSPKELNVLLSGQQPPLLVDVRSARSREDGFIPGSTWLNMHALDDGLRELRISDEVVLYCSCPNEASAALVAKRLLRAGFARVRPLKGGIEGWIEAGYSVQTTRDDGGPRQHVANSGAH